MERRVRRNRSAAFNTKVALAAVRGKKTLNELAVQFDLHANQIKQWKDQLLGGGDKAGWTPAHTAQDVGAIPLHVRLLSFPANPLCRPNYS